MIALGKELPQSIENCSKSANIVRFSTVSLKSNVIVFFLVSVVYHTVKYSSPMSSLGNVSRAFKDHFSFFHY